MDILPATPPSSSTNLHTHPPPPLPFQIHYTPPRHPNTGVNDEERLYESYLLPISEAIHRLRGTGQEWVVFNGWSAICERARMEAQDNSEVAETRDGK